MIFWIKKNRTLCISLILLFLTSLISLSWFKADLIYSFGDFTLNFSPTNNINQFLFIWNENITTGVANFQNFPNIFPYQAILYLCDSFGIPLYIGQRFVFWGLFLISGVGMFTLILTISKENKSYIWAVFSALFYMMNPFSLIIIWGVLGKAVFFYAFLPLLLAIYIKLIDGKRPKARYVLLFLLISSLATPAFSVLTFVADLWLVILCYLGYSILFRKEKKNLKLQYIAITALLFVVWVTINSYWLLPYQSQAQALAESSKNLAATNPSAVLKGASRTAQLVNTYRLFGYNVFREKFMNIDPFYPYAETYKTPLYVGLGFLITIFIFSAYYFPYKNRYLKDNFYLVFFCMFSTLFLFFYKGINHPFGDIYAGLADKSALFALAFRNPIDKIGIITTLGFSVLFGYSVNRLSLLSGKIGKIIVPVSIAITVFIIYLFPFWRGEVFYQGGQVYRSSLVKVPDYYWQAAEWLKNQEDNFRLYPVPLTDMYGLPLDWEHGYDAANPLTLIFDKPIIFTGEANEPQRKIWRFFNSEDLISEDSLKYLRGILTVNQIKYFVVHDDVAEDYFSVNKITLNTVRNRIKENLTLINKFDKLSFYALDNTPLLPKIMLSTEEVSTTSAMLGDFIRPEYIKVNPTKWVFDVDEWGVDKTIFLTFLEKFDSNWKVYLLPGKRRNLSFISELTETWLYPPMNERYHETVYDYANLWQIKNHRYYGPFRIIIEYAPQRLFYVGILITIVTLSIIMVFSINKLLRRGNRR